jgi:SAM-dependent methyltransferase
MDALLSRILPWNRRKREAAWLAWRSERQRDGEEALKRRPPDYTRYHCAQAAKLLDLRRKSILVVGCYEGSNECRYFVEIGAASVTGIDVLEKIGRGFTHPAVKYLRASAEDIPLDTAQFDLVFAVATLEHVPNIMPAFREMARVAAPGGFIYSAASPLWCTRAGPHWGSAFDHEPWPHLRMSVEEIVAVGHRCSEAGSVDRWHTEDEIRYHVDDPAGMFNKRRAHEYIEACASLKGVEIIRNDIDLESSDGVNPAIVKTLMDKGYTELDLFGLTHNFIARRL